MRTRAVWIALVALAGIVGLGVFIPAWTQSSKDQPRALPTDSHLAILNLVARYAHSYDEARLDEFENLFAADAALDMDGLKMKIGPEMRLMLEARSEGFKKAGQQRRHHFSAPVVEADGPHRATVRLNALIVSTNLKTNQRNLVATGVYEGVLTQQKDSAWKIADWAFKPDGRMGD